MADSPLNEAASGLTTFTVLIDGNAIDDSYSVIYISVDKAVNKVPSAKVVLLDGDASIQDFEVSNSADFVPGNEIEIKAGYESTEETIFKGTIVRHGLRVNKYSASELVIECRDKAVKMTIGRNNASFVDKKDSDAITTLIGNHVGLSSDVTATSVQHSKLTQYYSSDWDFMVSRAEVNGLLVVPDDGKVAVKAPDVSSSALLTVTFGDSMISFDADMDAISQLKATEADYWDVTSQAIGNSTGSDPSVNAQGNITGTTLSDVASPTSYKLQSPAILASDDAKAWADSALLKSRLAKIRGTVSFQGNAKPKPNTIIELQGVGDRFNGDAFVGCVNHVLEEGDWITTVEFGLSPNWFTEEVAIEAPPASGVLPGIQGVFSGTVKQIDQDPDGENRILVTIPIMKEDTDGTWARLSTFYATNNAGAFFMPEVGDEVLLAFINGDPRFPVILGSVYSSKITAPLTPDAANPQKAIVSKNQLKITFDDDKKIIIIETPGKNMVTFSDEGKSIEIKDQNSNKATFDSSGIILDCASNMTLKAAGNIDIKATGNLALQATGDLTGKGLNISQTADVGFTAKGNATAEISASGQTTVKGAMVMIN